jgi:hypothetical protein
MMTLFNDSINDSVRPPECMNFPIDIRLSIFYSVKNCIYLCLGNMMAILIY